MADCPQAVVLSAILLSVGFSLFLSPLPEDTSKASKNHPFAAFIFLTAVFAWISAQDINIFFCRLSSVSLFFYEFFVSLFIMEMSLLLFWRPLESFITSTLPSLVEKVLLKESIVVVGGGGGCALYGFYCSGHTIAYSVLVHIMAVNVLWCVLLGFGVVQEPILKL